MNEIYAEIFLYISLEKISTIIIRMYMIKVYIGKYLMDCVYVKQMFTELSSRHLHKQTFNLIKASEIGCMGHALWIEKKMT